MDADVDAVEVEEAEAKRACSRSTEELRASLCARTSCSGAEKKAMGGCVCFGG